MHAALKIPEIVHEIIWYHATFLGQDIEDTKESKNVLLALCLTCKTFCNPALDALWSNMDNLVPLFKLISNFKPRQDRDSEDVGVYLSL